MQRRPASVRVVTEPPEPGLGSLAGKVALVTGAASGIGAATARRLAAAGATVFGVDLDAAGLERVSAETGGASHLADAGDPDAVEAAFAACEEAFGGPDLAFLNAGIAIGIADPADIDDATYRRITSVNLDGVFFGLRAAVPRMRRRGGGAIVATSSLAGIIPFPPDPVYVATKHAVVGLIRSVAPTLAPHGITANTVNPGMTDTNILTPETKALFAQAGFPLIAPEAIAEAVMRILAAGRTGECWVCQPGREPEPYRFGGVPGPRGEGTGRTPPPVPAP